MYSEIVTIYHFPVGKIERKKPTKHSGIPVHYKVSHVLLLQGEKLESTIEVKLEKVPKGFNIGERILGESVCKIPFHVQRLNHRLDK